jgi:hypothetical protein
MMMMKIRMDLEFLEMTSFYAWVIDNCEEYEIVNYMLVHLWIYF